MDKEIPIEHSLFETIIVEDVQHILSRSDSAVQFTIGGLIMGSKYEIIIFWSEEDNEFAAEVPELPGCMASGETYQVALSNAEQIIQEWIDSAKELGRTVPEPKGRLVYA